jgi:hypothetical protein
MRQPQPAGANFFLYARAECELARTCSCTCGRKVTGRGRNATGRGRNANRRGRVAMGEDYNDMARTVRDGCGRLVIGANGLQWARATLRGADERPCVTAYSAGADTFPPGVDAFCLMK